MVWEKFTFSSMTTTEKASYAFFLFVLSSSLLGLPFFTQYFTTATHTKQYTLLWHVIFYTDMTMNNKAKNAKSTKKLETKKNNILRWRRKEKKKKRTAHSRNIRTKWVTQNFSVTRSNSIWLLLPKMRRDKSSQTTHSLTTSLPLPHTYNSHITQRSRRAPTWQERKNCFVSARCIHHQSERQRSDHQRYTYVFIKLYFLVIPKMHTGRRIQCNKYHHYQWNHLPFHCGARIYYVFTCTMRLTRFGIFLSTLYQLLSFFFSCFVAEKKRKRVSEKKLLATTYST